MSGPPKAQSVHRTEQIDARVREGVGDLGRGARPNSAPDDAVGFELTKLGRENLLAHPRQKTAKLGESLRTEPEVPDG